MNSLFHEISSFYLKICKTVLFFLLASIITGLISIAIVFPLWYFSITNKKCFTFFAVSLVFLLFLFWILSTATAYLKRIMYERKIIETFLSFSIKILTLLSYLFIFFFGYKNFQEHNYFLFSFFILLAVLLPGIKIFLTSSINKNINHD